MMGIVIVHVSELLTLPLFSAFELFEVIATGPRDAFGEFGTLLTCLG